MAFMSGTAGKIIAYVSFAWLMVAGFFASLFFAGAVALSSWNETDYKMQQAVLAEASTRLVEYSSPKLSRANDGRLVFVNGAVSTKQHYVDKDTGITIQTAKAQRKPMIYQWVEHEHDSDKSDKDGKSVTEVKYWYNPEWVEDPVDSNEFKIQEGHKNTGALSLESTTWTASDTQVGTFHLAPELQARITDLQTYYIPDDATARSALDALNRHVHSSGPPIDGHAKRHDDWSLHNGILYTSEDPEHPQIGDQKLTYFYLNPDEKYSFMAKQSGDYLVEYGDKGVKVGLVTSGNERAKDMIEKLGSEKQVQVWVLRAVVCVLIYIGLIIFCNPLLTLFAFLPLVGEIGMVLLFIAMCPVSLALTWGLVTLFHTITINVGLIYGAIACGAIAYVIVMRSILIKRKPS